MKSKTGQSLVEVGLTMALVSIVAVAVLGEIGTQVNGIFNSVATSIETAVNITDDNSVNSDFLAETGGVPGEASECEPEEGPTSEITNSFDDDPFG